MKSNFCFEMCSRLPIVFILGATGSGKTKLSLEIAKQFSGEIISADSMQVYKGLDIITAKVTKEEQSLVPHHLIDIVEPHEAFTVLEYRNQALHIIGNLLRQNKLPIIVGGTNYYIESLLWDILVDGPSAQSNVKSGGLSDEDYKLSSTELHEKLKLLDPRMANRLHPNNKRKILRSIEILFQKGKRHSEILDEQHSSQGASNTSGPLRFPNSLILWLQCDKKTLDIRLNERVDEMLSKGLVDELLNVHRCFINPDYTKGIFQSIGFKEFHSYLTIDDKEKTSQRGAETLQNCIELLKVATRQFSRKQIRWIQNRFLGRSDRKTPPVYSLDVTDISKWSVNVSRPAHDIVRAYILGEQCPYQKLPEIKNNSMSNAMEETFNCDVCHRIFVGNFQWQCHLKSNRHKKFIAKKKCANEFMTKQKQLTQMTTEQHQQKEPEEAINQ